MPATQFDPNTLLTPAWTRPEPEPEPEGVIAPDRRPLRARKPQPVTATTTESEPRPWLAKRGILASSGEPLPEAVRTAILALLLGLKVQGPYVNQANAAVTMIEWLKTVFPPTKALRGVLDDPKRHPASLRQRLLAWVRLVHRRVGQQVPVLASLEPHVLAGLHYDTLIALPSVFSRKFLEGCRMVDEDPVVVFARQIRIDWLRVNGIKDPDWTVPGQVEPLRLVAGIRYAVKGIFSDYVIEQLGDWPEYPSTPLPTLRPRALRRVVREGRVRVVRTGNRGRPPNQRELADLVLDLDPSPAGDIMVKLFGTWFSKSTWFRQRRLRGLPDQKYNRMKSRVAA